MAQSPPYLDPFVCFACRRSFRRPGGDRDEAPCPVCGNRAIRLSRKFKPPRRGDVKQWVKVETLVALGFRFDTIHDGEGGTVRYPSTERGIPPFVKRVTELIARETDRHRSKTKPNRRRTQNRQRRRPRTGRRASE